MDSSYNIQNYFKRGRTVILTLRQGLEEGGSIQGRQWTDKETTLLMTLMDEFRMEFKGQKRRKKEVWNDVTKRMHQHSYTWTPEDCRKKWSNMVRTFKTIEEQRRHPEHPLKKTKWPFFQDMTKLLSTDGADGLPEASTVCAYMKEFPVLSEDDEAQIAITDSVPDQQDEQNADMIPSDHTHPGQVVVDEQVVIPDLEVGDAGDSGHSVNDSDGVHSLSQNLDVDDDTTRILSSASCQGQDEGQPATVDDAMQFYLVDNQDGDTRQSHNQSGIANIRSANSVAIDGQDFDTLATVAAAAASAGDSIIDIGPGTDPGNFPIPSPSPFDMKTLGKTFMTQNQINMINKCPITNTNQIQNELPVFTIPRIPIQNNVNVNMSIPGNSVPPVVPLEQQQQQILGLGTPLILPGPAPVPPLMTTMQPGKIDLQLPLSLINVSTSPLSLHTSQPVITPVTMTMTNPPLRSTLSTAVPISAPSISAHRKPGNLFKRRAKFQLRKDKDIKKRRSYKTGDEQDSGGAESGSETGDPLVDKFIAISNKQNERILERMEKFHEESLNVMRERNKLLENMVTFLKQQFAGTASAPATTGLATIGSPGSGIATTTGYSHGHGHHSQVPNPATIISVPASISSVLPGQQIVGSYPAKATSIRVLNPSIALARGPISVASGSSFTSTLSMKKP